MKLRRVATISCLIGFGLSAAGAGLIALGGWGPCGPASTVAAIGGGLTVIHIVWLFALFPDLEPLAGRWAPDWVLLLGWPSVVWSLLAFSVLAAWRWFKKGGPQSTQRDQ